MTRLEAPVRWIAQAGVPDGMGYAYAVGQDAGLIVAPVGPQGPINEDGRALFDQATVRGWWRLQARLPGFHAVPLLPAFWDLRTVMRSWPRRFAGVLYHRNAIELRAGLQEMAAWADRISVIETAVVSLKGVCAADIREALDAALDARFHVLV